MFTFAVMTCNRLYYLKNCVKSIIEFVGLDNIDLLIIDSHTQEKGTSEYLSSLPSGIHVKVFDHRSPNELHRAMNYAIKFSRKRNNKYVNFIQDDYQYLYEFPNLLSLVEVAFDKYPDVIQLQTNLIWKRKHHKIGKVSRKRAGGAKWYYLHNKSPCDNGFTRVSTYKKIGLYPKKTSIHGKEKGYRSGEAWFASKCKKYKRMLFSCPNMGMMMDCAYVRRNKRIGRYFPPPREYYLRPFSNSEIEAVNARSKANKFCFIEDMIVADGWTPDSMHKKHNERDIVVKI